MRSTSIFPCMMATILNFMNFLSFEKLNNIDTTGFVLKATYDTDKSDLEKKISDADKKIHDASNIAKKQI